MSSPLAEYAPDVVVEPESPSTTVRPSCRGHLRAMEEDIIRNDAIADGLERRCMEGWVPSQELEDARDWYSRQRPETWCVSSGIGHDQCGAARDRQRARHDEIRDEWTRSRARLQEAIHWANTIQRAQAPHAPRGLLATVSHYVSAALASFVFGTPEAGAAL